MALFEWQKPPPLERDYDGWNFSPFEPRKCPACEKVAKPRMTGFYRVAWVLLLLVFIPAIWLLPWHQYCLSCTTWSGHYVRADKITAIPVFLIAAWRLIYSRNAYRCCFCDAILW